MPSPRTTVKVGALSSKSLRAWVVAVAAVVASLQAHAAGLGRLEVKSALGDAFRAEISVLAEKNEVGSLSARMAPSEAFQRAGLIYGSAVAAMRVSVEKRANGDPFVTITSAEPVNEPVVDLLVELSWASGRVTREYTAFVDPPFLIAEREKQRAAATAAPVPAPAPAATTESISSEPMPQPEPLPAPAGDAVAEAPAVTSPSAEAQPAPVDEGPVETIGGTAPTLLEPVLAAAPEPAAAEDYGTVKRGDTLSKIALQTKPADVTLEQMLVLLFRSNPDAFAGKNMNRLKTGKVIQLPQPDQYGTVTAAQARQEVRVQAADWAAYRERLAGVATEQAPAAAEPAQQAAAGQITPRVEDKAKPQAAPKEVLKLSEGAPSGSTTGGGQQRTRALEEELVARDKAVAEANQRVARLEKTINDLQALLEVKNQGMAELQKQAAGAAPAAPAAQAPKPAAPEVAQPAPAPAAPAPKPAVPGSDARPPAPTAGSGQETPAAQPAPQAAAPAPKPRPKPPAPPPPPPSLIDQVLEEPLYLGAAALLLLVAGLGGVRALRRRREVKSESEDSAPAKGAAATFADQAGETTRLSSTQTDVGLAAARSGESGEEVDPLEEAEIFLAYGRDAQAEELLKEALQQHPRRHEIHVKLLEIFAKRKDKVAFEGVARELQQATGGKGDHWERAVRLGYQVDPSNGRYAAGKPSGDEVAAEAAAPDTDASPADRLDFDVGLGDDAASTTATDIDLGSDGSFDQTQIINPLEAGEPQAGAEQASVPDFNLDLPEIETPEGAEMEVSEAKAEPGGNSIDFDFDVSKLGGAEPAASTDDSAAESSSGLDFDIGSFSTEPEDASGAGQSDSASPSAPALDLSGISLDLDGTSTMPANTGGKDEKWYEVQTKFDLAKAYQEMGDKDGAREILKEVISEGDAEQQAAAEAVLSSLE
jgi:pilus assembly protein FimV